MIGFKFKYEPTWLTPFTNKVFQLSDASMGDQYVEERTDGRISVSGAIKCADHDKLESFAAHLPHIFCVPENGIMAYKYMMPDNGTIEFITSVQETNCVNIHIYDDAWAAELHRGTLFIRDILKINEISRHDNYSWYIDIMHKPDENLKKRMERSTLVTYYMTYDEYINPTTRRTRFIVRNTYFKSFHRIYESIGVGYGSNVLIYPLQAVIKVHDGVPDEWV